ncbi:MAG TPA: hypothetical protein VLG44_07775 [Chlamydiales bacterium]|nr:hypothetical protein [Chlamydiales bacterium]
MAAVAGAGSKTGFSVGYVDGKAKAKLTEAEIEAARKKWDSTDPALIAELGKPIIISGNRVPKSNVILGLNVKPGSTIAEIKPLFDARILDLTRKRDQAQSAYEALGTFFGEKETEAEEDGFLKAAGFKSSDVFSSVALAPGGILDQQNVWAIKRSQLQDEIDVLTQRFQPALDVFAILQKV